MKKEQGPEGSFLNGENENFTPSILVSNPYVRNTLLFLALASAGWGAWELSGRLSPVDVRCSIKESRFFDFDKEFHNKPIEGEEAKVYMTSGYEGSEFDFVPVREEPTQNDDCGNLVGWARFEQEVVAEPYFGTEYVSSGIDSHGLGKITGPDEEGYGKWFLVRKMVVLVKDEFGNYSKEQVMYDKLVSGNFLSPHPASLEIND